MTKLFMSASEEREFLEARVNALPAPLEILEAGCGRRPFIRVSVPHKLTGIDADEDALELRRCKHNDLHDVILGDLRETALSPARFDVIYCSFVLEHVDGAEHVLKNFVRWLKPGGLLIVRVPDRDSVWGFVTRYTPFPMHVFFRRYIMRQPNAGRPGHAPYPVHYDWVISTQGMSHFCSTHDLTVESVCRSGYVLRRSRIAQLASWLGGVLSLGRLASRHNNLTFIIRKN
jgi:SAM-dependent methyltransferase